MKKLFALLTVSLLVLSLLGACGTSASASGSVAAQGSAGQQASTQQGKKTFALVPPAMISPYYASVIKGAQAAADELGHELLILAPESESDYAAQVQIVEDMITQKVDGIILCAINADAITSAVKKANDANIPVVMFNTQNELAEGEVDCYVRYDQYEAGAKVADFVAEQFDGKAKVGIIEGLPSDHTTERMGGFVDRAAEKYPDIEVVASQPGDWEREKGMNAAANMLQANPDSTLFFGLSDEMALGAYQAVAQANATDKVKVCGFDGNPNAVASVVAGELLSTLSIGGPETGDACVRALDKIVNGTAVEKIVAVDTEVISAANAANFPAE
ncbi:MAG: sugar ABC transporter substrate-binding protein [Oscillospiraceae bacterium]